MLTYAYRCRFFRHSITLVNGIYIIRAKIPIIVSDIGTPEKGARLKSLDVLKGFIILIIVFAHLFMCVPGDGSRGPSSPIIATLYMGLMLFFLISGYFFRPGRSAKENILKRAIQLMIPLIAMCAIFPIILYGYLSLMGYSMDFVEGWTYCLRAIIGPITMGLPFDDVSDVSRPLMASFVGSYFLQVMLVGFIIFYVLAPRIRGDAKKTLVSLVVILTVAVLLRAFLPWQPPFFAILGIISSAFMIVGAECGRIKLIERVEDHALKSPKYLGTVAIAFIVTVVLVLLFNPGVEFDNNVFGEHGALSIYPFFITGLAASYWFITLGVACSKVPGLSKFLGFLGKHTLVILVMHGFAAKLIIPLLGYQLTTLQWVPEMSMVNTVITGFGAIAIAIATSEIGCRYVVPKLAKYVNWGSD